MGNVGNKFGNKLASVLKTETKQEIVKPEPATIVEEVCVTRSEPVVEKPVLKTAKKAPAKRKPVTKRTTTKKRTTKKTATKRPTTKKTKSMSAKREHSNVRSV